MNQYFILISPNRPAMQADESIYRRCDTSLYEPGLDSGAPMHDSRDTSESTIAHHSKVFPFFRDCDELLSPSVHIQKRIFFRPGKYQPSLDKFFAP
jgi:hypothetical protein